MFWVNQRVRDALSACFVERLKPARGDLDSLYAILDDRERPYYEHRLAA